MSAAATKPATSQPQVVAAYCCDEGTRQLVGQRPLFEPISVRESGGNRTD
jgi:hypothetical protein